MTLNGILKNWYKMGKYKMECRKLNDMKIMKKMMRMCWHDFKWPETICHGTDVKLMTQLKMMRNEMIQVEKLACQCNLTLVLCQFAMWSPCRRARSSEPLNKSRVSTELWFRWCSEGTETEGFSFARIGHLCFHLHHTLLDTSSAHSSHSQMFLSAKTDGAQSLYS